MAKLKVKRACQGQQNAQIVKKAKISIIATPPPDAHSEPKTLRDLGLSQDDLEISVDTLNTLSTNPAYTKLKICKDIRTAVFGFRQACTIGANSTTSPNLTARISGAIADGAYIEAQVLLAELRIRGQAPKLGALCRWVRDLDVVSGFAEQISDTDVKRSMKETQLLLVLDAILRAVGPVDYSDEPDLVFTHPIIHRQSWNLRSNRPRQPTYASILDHSIYSYSPENITSNFRIIETTPGLERKPPNLYPAVLYTSNDGTITFSIQSPETKHHLHPNVPNLHLFQDVLTPEECSRIIGAAEMIGFTPDAPICAPGEESSVLAHNFYWVVDNTFCTELWKRVKTFIPAQICGKSVRGLNRRFRVYRYVPGAEYRAHIDGAWPPSSIELSTDKYIYDSSPINAKQSSLFTFLIYLNDEFEAGETTFFLPSFREGRINAYPVKPIQGSVIMFPHGDTEGSLLHEGTGVRQGSQPSAKYVIRTDVLYDT